MNAYKPWNYHSHVKCCTECNGAGVVPSHRQPTISDPYPETACECGLGEHEPECAVCGFNLPLPGYDCIVCETVASLFPADMKRLSTADFATAMRVAITKALTEAERLAA